MRSDVRHATHSASASAVPRSATGKAVPVTPTTNALRDYLEAAAEARRRGDLAAAECAETMALLLLRNLVLPVQAGGEARPHA